MIGNVCSARRLPQAQRDAVIGAYIHMAFDARHFASQGHRVPARESARMAREILAAFGIRRDGKRRSPFAFVPVDRPRCNRCGKSPVTAGPFIRLHTVLIGGHDLGTREYCGDCAEYESTQANPPFPLYDVVEVVESPEEAACAA